MKTKKYLERLLKSDEVLNGTVSQFAYRRVDLDLAEAILFCEMSALSILIKLNRVAKTFENYYAEDDLRTSGLSSWYLQHLWRKNRKLKIREFWKKLDVEISKIRTRRLLEALLRENNSHVRRNHLTFSKGAAKDFYLNLNEEQKLLLMQNVYRKEENTLRMLNENVGKSKISEEDMSRFRESAIFWNDVCEFLSNIKANEAA